MHSIVHETFKGENIHGSVMLTILKGWFSAAMHPKFHIETFTGGSQQQIHECFLPRKFLGRSMVSYFGGFSMVRKVLKSVMSFCIPGNELGKVLSLSLAMVCSIHWRRLVIIWSYSSFMLSMSTRMPMIWKTTVHIELGRQEYAWYRIACLNYILATAWAIINMHRYMHIHAHMYVS